MSEGAAELTDQMCVGRPPPSAKRKLCTAYVSQVSAIMCSNNIGCQVKLVTHVGGSYLTVLPKQQV